MLYNARWHIGKNQLQWWSESQFCFILRGTACTAPQTYQKPMPRGSPAYCMWCGLVLQSLNVTYLSLRCWARKRLQTLRQRDAYKSDCSQFDDWCSSQNPGLPLKRGSHCSSCKLTKATMTAGTLRLKVYIKINWRRSWGRSLLGLGAQVPRKTARKTWQAHLSIHWKGVLTAAAPAWQRVP